MSDVQARELARKAHMETKLAKLADRLSRIAGVLDRIRASDLEIADLEAAGRRIDAHIQSLIDRGAILEGILLQRTAMRQAEQLRVNRAVIRDISEHTVNKLAAYRVTMQRLNRELQVMTAQGVLPL